MAPNADLSKRRELFELFGTIRGRHIKSPLVDLRRALKIPRPLAKIAVSGWTKEALFLHRRASIPEPASVKLSLVEHLQPLVHHYGYLAVLFFVALESAGIPMPGETVLISAAIFAGAGALNIFLVIACAAIAAITGDNAGYWVGREFGFPLIHKYGAAAKTRRGAAQGRAVSVSAPWRQDRIFWPLRRGSSRLCRLPRRGQSFALAALPRFQRAWRNRLGDDFWRRRLFPRPRVSKATRVRWG